MLSFATVSRDLQSIILGEAKLMTIFFCYLIKCNCMPCPCLSFSIGFKILSFVLHDFCLVSNFQFLVCIFLISVNYFRFDACYLRDSPPTPYSQPRYKRVCGRSILPQHTGKTRPSAQGNSHNYGLQGIDKIRKQKIKVEKVLQKVRLLRTLKEKMSFLLCGDMNELFI